jgi:putative chitinase
MEITVEQLRKIMPKLKLEKAEEYLPFLNSAMEEFYINTELRVSAFLSQLAHESSELSRLVENLNYSAKGLLLTFSKYFNINQVDSYAHEPEKIANKVYADRMGNGNQASGEGWKYRGHGPIQLTGKANHILCGIDLKIDLVNHPELAAEKENMFRVAAWFWDKNKLNALADSGEYKKITRSINGGYNGLDERYTYYRKAKEVLGII